LLVTLVTLVTFTPFSLASHPSSTCSSADQGRTRCFTASSSRASTQVCHGRKWVPLRTCSARCTMQTPTSGGRSRVPVATCVAAAAKRPVPKRPTSAPKVASNSPNPRPLPKMAPSSPLWLLNQPNPTQSTKPTLKSMPAKLSFTKIPTTLLTTIRLAQFSPTSTGTSPRPALTGKALHLYMPKLPTPSIAQLPKGAPTLSLSASKPLTLTPASLSKLTWYPFGRSLAAFILISPTLTSLPDPPHGWGWSSKCPWSPHDRKPRCVPLMSPLGTVPGLGESSTSGGQSLSDSGHSSSDNDDGGSSSNDNDDGSWGYGGCGEEWQSSGSGSGDWSGWDECNPDVDDGNYYDENSDNPWGDYDDGGGNDNGGNWDDNDNDNDW